MTHHPDRPMKVLLALLVAGIWGLLLRPLFILAPAQAQDQSGQAATSLITKTEVAGDTLYVFFFSGRTPSNSGTLKVKAYRAHPEGGRLLLQESEERELPR